MAKQDHPNGAFVQLVRRGKWWYDNVDDDDEDDDDDDDNGDGDNGDVRVNEVSVQFFTSQGWQRA